MDLLLSPASKVLNNWFEVLHDRIWYQNVLLYFCGVMHVLIWKHLVLDYFWSQLREKY